LRAPSQILFAVFLLPGTALAQLSGGFGPIGRLSSTASTWRSSAQLWGTARFENPFATTGLAGQFGGATPAFRGFSGEQRVFSPAIAGVRSVTAVDYAQANPLDITTRAGLSVTSSLSMRRGFNGAWIGAGAEKDIVAPLRLGGWRQLSRGLTIAVSSSIRRSTYGARASRSWTEFSHDSIWTDTGWVQSGSSRIRTDSGSAGRKVSWPETEARLGWSRGRLAFDGVMGWRPAFDSIGNTNWFSATVTFAVAKRVALSAGAGTNMKSAPFAQPTGRYATLALRLAPAALVRPPDIPEITPTASSFRIERLDGQYLIRVRLPRARTVELSGDFNGWQPVNLTRELDGSWTIALDLKPGAYRMNLRVDGERWLPPPGITSVDDEFNGKVGLITVR
jgi:hypothetical protein